MKAVVNGSHAILDYFQLTYSSMPLVRTIVHNIKDVKKWHLATIVRLEIAPIDKGTALCTVDFQDGSTQSMEFEDPSDGRYTVPRPSAEIVVNRASAKEKLRAAGRRGKWRR